MVRAAPWHLITRGLRIASGLLSMRCISSRTMIEHLFPHLMGRCGKETGKTNEINGKKYGGGPGRSDTRQSAQWFACQTALRGPFERKRVSRQVSKYMPPDWGPFSRGYRCTMILKQRDF